VKRDPDPAFELTNRALRFTDHVFTDHVFTVHVFTHHLFTDHVFTNHVSRIIHSMSPIYCHECGRANGSAATKCLWCGVPISDVFASASRIETTRVEIGYLGGIDRLEDPGPVRLTIGADGIEIAELVPGTRSIKIPASSIIEANVVDSSRMVEGKRARPAWWWLALEPLALAFRGKKTPDAKEHDYILTIRYQGKNEVCNAVFHRVDRPGLAVVEGLARIVSSLVRKKNTLGND